MAKLLCGITREHTTLGKRLLWIQKRPEHVRAIREEMRSKGWDVKILVCRDGERATNYLYGPEPPRRCPRLILLDYSVESVPARGLLWLIRRHRQTSTVPVYILADPDSFGSARQLMDSGATGVLMKPVNFEQLMVICVQWSLLQYHKV